jgi:hypothetical protein
MERAEKRCVPRGRELSKCLADAGAFCEGTLRRLERAQDQQASAYYGSVGY